MMTFENWYMYIQYTHIIINRTPLISYFSMTYANPTSYLTSYAALLRTKWVVEVLHSLKSSSFFQHVGKDGFKNNYDFELEVDSSINNFCLHWATLQNDLKAFKKSDHFVLSSPFNFLLYILINYLKSALDHYQNYK